MIRDGVLVLADGSVFEGELLGAENGAAASSGEVVFNTVLSGYQEVITDPSYAGQIITFTTPHIGNYGVNATDFEARRPFCRGIIVRDLARRHSNHRAEASLDAMLARYSIAGIGGIDTRRLTRLLRDTGAMPGAFGADEATARAAAASEKGTDGIDLVAEVTTPQPYSIGAGARHVVAYDFGLKHSILRDLSGLGRITVVPAGTTAAEVIAMRPDGVFLSNGPGDPAQVGYAVAAIRELLGKLPVFGICLGHQLLCRAIGGDTFKLAFGHHGGNHPVRHETT
ncbi:MAG: carA, partial [Acidimicrobiaceae bacterium]